MGYTINKEDFRQEYHEFMGPVRAEHAPVGLFFVR